MKLSFLATLALAAGAIAQGGGQGGGNKQIANGQPCTKDGKMGSCESGFCKQTEDEDQGECAPKN